MSVRRLRIVVTQPIHREHMMRLTAESHLDVIGPLHSDPLPVSEIAEAAKSAEILLTQLTDPITALLFEDPALRLVAAVAVGVDNIDLQAAARAGVLVTNTPGVLTATTADMALALMLATARRVPEGDSQLRAKAFGGWRLLQEPMGTDISGATLGIIGLGRIGMAVARRGHAGFEMPIIYSGGGADRQGAEALGARELPFDEVLAQSDFISLHVPLTPVTYHLIDKRAFSLMRPSAILVNTARGPIIDEAALAEALEQKRIRGAGLDVFEDEPRVDGRLLNRRENVVLTPHLGSATDATRRRMSEMAVANILAFARGDSPPNTVALLS